MFESIVFRWKNIYKSNLLKFIKCSNEDLTSMWDFATYYVLANFSDPLIALADTVVLAILILVCVCIYIFILCGCRQQRLWWVCTFTFTLQWVLVQNQLCWLVWFILCYNYYNYSYNLLSLIWNIKRINRMQLHKNTMFPCSMLSTKSNK